MKRITKSASNRLGIWLGIGLAFGIALGIVGKQLVFWTSVGVGSWVRFGSYGSPGQRIIQARSSFYPICKNVPESAVTVSISWRCRSSVEFSNHSLGSPFGRSRVRTSGSPRKTNQPRSDAPLFFPGQSTPAEAAPRNRHETHRRVQMESTVY